ncbi:MAG: pyridoxamine 5'-phosphate oxidase [Bacteroidota bacterium]|nr:pyridoxamine 5'-phosphate oxidase [Bacteroidota bacterium]
MPIFRNFVGHITNRMDPIKDYLKNLRTDYNLDIFDTKTANPDPFLQFGTWMKMAVDNNLNEPNAFNLATVSAQNRPSSRIVLLRNFDEAGFVFFTNYNSHKASELSNNKWAAINFFWAELHKQVRIEGKAEKVADLDSEAYFKSRPRESQLGAWVSEQSSELTSREEMDEKFKILTKKFEGRDVDRPPHWGGFRIRPELFEFWQGRPNRLHDRIQYRLQPDSSWSLHRLYP